MITFENSLHREQYKKRYKTDRIPVERALEGSSPHQSHMEIYAHKQRNRKY